jgi:putative permease
MNMLGGWIRRQMANPQIVILTLSVLSVVAGMYLFGDMLAPLLAAVVIAYLLEGLVERIERRKVPHLPAVLIVFFVFFTFLVFAAFGLLPMLIRQVASLIQQVPAMIAVLQEQLLLLPSRTSMITEDQVQELVSGVGAQVLGAGQYVLTYSMSSLITVITLGVYLVLLPVLVFFLLKDKDEILQWCGGFLPRERPLVNQVWAEVDRQIGNYARGKVWEILIVGSVTFVAFRILGLQYALLLSVVTGFSVLVPYIGAAVVGVPVAAVAFFQWGLTSEFVWAVVAYGVIQFLDGNLLVPLLFSEAVNLHPVAIIAAVLVFGGMWGFWGVFFAIPLATVLQALIRAWPRQMAVEAEPVEDSG